MENQLAKRVIDLLAGRGETLSLVESCTGGQLSAAITSIPGASKVYVGGVVAYSNAVKATLLGVDWATLDEFGAVSRECARELAQCGLTALHSDWCVAVTGIAGPGGRTLDKPVGLVYLAIAGPEGLKVEEHQFDGERGEVQQRAVGRALAVLKSMAE